VAEYVVSERRQVSKRASDWSSPALDSGLSETRPAAAALLLIVSSRFPARRHCQATGATTAPAPISPARGSSQATRPDGLR
jgi:hypothetical protein